MDREYQLHVDWPNVMEKQCRLTQRDTRVRTADAPIGSRRSPPWADEGKEATKTPPWSTEDRASARSGASGSASPWRAWQSWDEWGHQRDTWTDAVGKAKGKRSSPRGKTHCADKRQRGWDFCP
eukprot:50551-Pyramimonas_sp.AAC.1